MGKAIYSSTWDAINSRNWRSLRGNQWQDFALILFELDSELNTKGILVERGKAELEADTNFQAQGIGVETLNRKLILDSDTDLSVAIFVSSINFYEMLMYYLPWYDKVNLTFQNLCRVIDISFRFIEEQIDRVDRNLNLDSAIEVLGIFERRLGIESKTDISYEQRRRQIEAVMNSMHSQITEELVKQLCSAFSSNDASVEVIKMEHRDVLDIRFVANGIPNNWNALDDLLKKILPAHLKWKYSFTQNSWDKIIDKKRWRDVTENTWKEINTYKEVI